ncbi:hypothetical protein HXY32_08110 [Candidatus Bathyarchaeota archaeon]|nr:hypothetical protein [Candidatus Bathyarchaeota archaeon]
MKTITMVIRQTEISRLFPQGLQFLLDDNASMLDVIKAVDEEIKKKCTKFPAKEYESLLQMVYHPYENRFYKQVAIQAYVKSKLLINIRENLKMPLPDGTTIILIPQGGCITDWEEPVR